MDSIPSNSQSRLRRRTLRWLLLGSAAGLAIVVHSVILAVIARPLAVSAQSIKSTGPLKIVDVLFEDYDGWPSPRLTVPAGGEAVLHFRIDGFERNEGRDANDYPEYRVRLQYEIELRDPQGALVIPVERDSFQPILGPQDDTWRPLVRWSAAIPPWAPSGNYPIRIRARDEIGEQQAEQSVQLQVRGEGVRASDSFQAQGLEFARTPDGPWTSTRYFALRDPIFVRFNVVGYRVSPDKRIWVEQDWTVVDEQGQIIIHQPNVVQQQLQEFYPPRFLTTNFRLEFDDPQPGAYTLQIALRDRIGDQSVSQDAPFNLRP